jgi:hypothetical protein
MPFDATTFESPKRKTVLRGNKRLRPETIQARARRAADGIGYLIRRYESGDWPWVQGWCHPGYPQSGICAGWALRKIKSCFMIRENWIYDYVARAIGQEPPCEGPVGMDPSLDTIIQYNDRRGRTFSEVMNVLHRARQLAEEEARYAI